MPAPVRLRCLVAHNVCAGRWCGYDVAHTTDQIQRMQRRHFLKNAAAALAALGLPALPPWALAAKAVGLRRLGQPQPFDYAWLKGQARALAKAPYKATSRCCLARWNP